MRRSCASALLAFFAGALAGEAQQARKVYRVGFLEASSLAASSARIEAFRQGLRELGHIEGQDLRIDWRFADGRQGGLSGFAIELVGLKPDVLVSSSAVGVDALRKATPALPIVIAGADAGARLIVPENLARPGGNVTGVISADGELEGKRMEFLREAVPAVARVATFQDYTVLLYRPADAAKSRPERWGFTFIPIAVRGPEDFEGAFATAIREGASALSLLNTPMFYTHRRRLADLAARNRLAWVAPDREYAEAGCLMSYGADRTDLVRRAATYVSRILKGARPADLPVEQPTRFEVAINSRTAKALGLTIPQSVLLRADRVIE